MAKKQHDFIPLGVAIITVSGRRTAADDTSGDYLHSVAELDGHKIVGRAIVAEDRYALRAQVSHWIASTEVQVILINGGTGFNTKNQTPEALLPLFDREIEGFGEMFRWLSYQDIGGASMQSRALAGIANRTAIFAMPGSTDACQLAWEKLIQSQLDARQGPCNFYPHVKNSSQ